jgi:ubiquinone/menaquinone biosynthesis C-methylase UbiE
VSPTGACCSSNVAAASNAFDQIAEAYDELFTRSVIGRAQRAAVWDVLANTLHRGERVLELNCGTGEDALFLGRRGVSVLACDASPAMVHVARKRVAAEGSSLPVAFQTCRTEDIANLNFKPHSFDGVLSNFSGLNCVEDLRSVAKSLAPIVTQGASLLFCLSSRICISEILWFSVHLDFRKALRRIGGEATARIGSAELCVRYPTVSQVRRAFAPWFRLNLIRAVGLCVPPSYLEYWAAAHQQMIGKLSAADRMLAPLPILRTLGDHVLLRFERVVS